MRAVEYIGKAEGIRSREKGAEARIEQLSQSIDRLSRRKRALQEEIRQLSQEEDGLEDNLSELETELADIQQDIAEKQGQKELAQQELHDAVEERQATLFEIQEAARVHSRDLSGASNLFGSFAQIGSNLSMAFQGALGSLSQAASILGGSVDNQEGTGAGRRGSHSGFTPGISGGTADEGTPYASHQISGARTLLGHFSSALVKILPTFSSSQLSSQGISLQSARPSSGKSESSFISAQTSGFTQTPNNFTTGLPPQKYMTTEEGKVRTDDKGKVHMYREGRQWKLKPNCEYQSRGYYYRTDEKGRITHVEGALRLSEEGRKSLNAKLEDMEYGDQRGHIIADMFGGSNLIDNLIPQLSEVNQGNYKVFEIDLAKAVDLGKTVEVKYEVIYDDDSKRPSELDVEYTINGEAKERVFDNRRG